MRKIFLVLVCSLFFSTVSSAADKQQLASVKVSPDWGKAQCASRPGDGVILNIKSVDDRRETKAVGTLKKGDSEIEVLPADPIDVIVKNAVSTVLKNCGFDVRTGGGEGIATVIELDRFYAGAKKGLFTGETNATGAMVLRFSNNGRSYDFTLSASNQDKRLRKKNIKQLEDVLSGVMEMMVNQISESPQLFTELRTLAK